MAHIGAMPGSPLYDADGGMEKLVEGVLSDIEKVAGRVVSTRLCSAMKNDGHT